jgi:hypothetical protein
VLPSAETKPALRALTIREREGVLLALLECRVAPEPICRRSVELARLVPRMPRWAEIRGPRSLVAHVALASRADGIALGSRVFIRRELFADDGGLPPDLLAHELAHVAQILRDGPMPFYLRYGAAYAAGRARGLDDRRAYLAIPYEEEARRVGAAAVPGGATVRRIR